MLSQTDSVASQRISKLLDDNGWPLHRVARELLGFAVDDRDPAEIYLIDRIAGHVIPVVRNADDIEIAHVPYALSVYNQLNTVGLVQTIAGLPDGDAAVAYLGQHPLIADILKPAAPKPELDLTFEVAKTLQAEGRSLVAIATQLFGYSGRRAEGNEFYLSSPPHQEILAVTENTEGLQIAHFPFGLQGRTQMNAARFVMEHAGLRSPLEVLPYVRARMPIGRPDLT